MHTHYLPAFRTTQTPAETQVSSPPDGVHRAPKRTADKRATAARTATITSTVGRKAARHHLRDATATSGACSSSDPLITQLPALRTTLLPSGSVDKYYLLFVVGFRY
jgi:hypothetical protein